MRNEQSAQTLPHEWSSAISRHLDAVESYCSTARRFDDLFWVRPVADGKWTPAEVTEHLNRTYDVILAQISGGTGIKVQTNWLLRAILRVTVLPWIFRKRALPRGAKAPKEVKPERVVDSRADAIARMVALARKFENLVREVHTDAEIKLSHHIFGEIDLLHAVDFVAIHIEHHQRQIEAVVV